MKLQEIYKDYKPPFEVISTVKYLINQLPKRYLNGLGSVILTNFTGLPREKRRNLKESTLGVYYHKYKGKPPYIYLFIDNIFQNYNSIILKFRFVRIYIIAQTFYHEIAHHIHRTMIPKHLDAEFIADDWRDKFVKKYLFKSYYGSIILFKIIRFLHIIYRLFILFFPFIYVVIHYFYFSNYIKNTIGIYKSSSSIFYLVYGILLKFFYDYKIVGYIFIVLCPITFLYGLIYTNFGIKFSSIIETVLLLIIILVGFIVEEKSNK